MVLSRHNSHTTQVTIESVKLNSFNIVRYVQAQQALEHCITSKKKPMTLYLSPAFRPVLSNTNLLLSQQIPLF